MPTQKLSADIIEAAIEGFKAQQTRIEGQIAELRAMLRSAGGSTSVAASPSGRGKFSAATRQKMKEAQQRRWAKVRGESNASAAAPKTKAKRKLSRAGRAAIVAALKKRWAAKRAEAASGESAAKKGGRKKAAEVEA
jgi:hypothetical protein